MAVRFVDRTTAAVRLAANTMDVLLLASNVKTGIDRGDGTVGTYGGGGIDVADIVDPAYVIVGHDNYTGGEAGTFVVPAEADVEYGVTYGTAAEFTGTLAVPDYSSVSATASRLQQVGEALVALLDAADLAGAFYESLGATRDYASLLDLTDVGESIVSIVAPQYTERARTSNGTYGRYVVVEILVLRHLSNDASEDVTMVDRRALLLEQIDNYLAAEANCDLTLPDGKLAQYVEPTDARSPSSIREGLGPLLDIDAKYDRRQVTGLVRVAYWVDEDY